MVFATGIPFPEGPAFLPDGALVVCARRDHYLVRVAPDGSVARLWDMPGLRPNGCKRHRDGRLFVAAMTGPSIVAVDAHGHIEPVVTLCDDGPLLGPNDLIFGADGALYFTDPGMEFEPVGRVCRARRNGDPAEVLARGLSYPNGLVLTADGVALLVAETGTRRILRLELNSTQPSPPCTFAELRGGIGPDGMALDVEGNLYIAHTGQGCVTVVDCDGHLREQIPLGGQMPTNLAFRDRALYVTEDDNRGVLRLDLGVAGLPLYGDDPQ
jgi:sugar lactone lactonase YvrE